MHACPAGAGSAVLGRRGRPGGQRLRSSMRSGVEVLTHRPAPSAAQRQVPGARSTMAWHLPRSLGRPCPGALPGRRAGALGSGGRAPPGRRGESGWRAVDSASPEGAAGWPARASKSTWMRTAWSCWKASLPSSRAPACPRTPRSIAAARERGIAVIGELELAWRLLPNRFVAVTGTNGKTTTDRADRPSLARPRASRWRWPATSARPRLAGRRGRPRGDGGLRVLELPARGLRGSSRPSARCFSTSPPTTSTATATSTATCARSCGSSPTRETTTSPSTTAPSRRCAASTSAAARGGSRFCRGADPDCELSLREGVDLRRRRAAARGGRAEPARPAQRRQRDGGRRGGAGDGPRARRGAGGAAHLRRHPAPARARRRDRRRALRQRLEGDQCRGRRGRRCASFDGGVRAILGGSLKGGGFEALAEPVRERCVACYLIGDAAERLERDLEPARDAGVELRRCDGLADAVRAAAADARAGRGGPARARLRELRRLPGLRGARRALPLAGRGARRLGRKVRALGANSQMDDGALAQPAGPADAEAPGAQPVEYNLLLTATLCLLAFGVVMVFSASSTTSLLGKSGDSAYYLKRTAAVRGRRPARDARPVAARAAPGAAADAAAARRPRSCSCSPCSCPGSACRRTVPSAGSAPACSRSSRRSSPSCRWSSTAPICSPPGHR